MGSFSQNAEGNILASAYGELSHSVGNSRKQFCPVSAQVRKE